MEFKISDEQRHERIAKLQHRADEFKETHFGARYRNARGSTAEKSINSQDLGRVWKWWEEGRNSLVLLGPPGTGKTFLCAALADLVFSKYDTVRYWKEARLFSRLREAIESNQDYLDTLHYCIDDQFVYLDDIGSTPANDWRKEIVFNVIDIRYNMMLPTVFTSNLNREQIAKQYDERTASRLFSQENTIVTFWGNQDLRAIGM